MSAKIIDNLDKVRQRRCKKLSLSTPLRHVVGCRIVTLAVSVTAGNFKPLKCGFVVRPLKYKSVSFIAFPGTSVVMECTVICRLSGISYRTETILHPPYKDQLVTAVERSNHV